MTSGRAPVNKRGLTQKQETFCLEYFKGGNASQSALVAGYSPRTAMAMGHENLGKPQILARLSELRKKAEHASVMSVLERKQRLSEIARARLTDFTEADEHGARIKVGLESANSAALQEVTTETFGGDEKPVIQVTKLKLHDPVRAMAELNKMDGAYAPVKQEHSGTITVLTVAVRDIAALFERVNLLPDPEARRREFAMGADRIIEGQFKLMDGVAG